MNGFLFIDNYAINAVRDIAKYVLSTKDSYYWSTAFVFDYMFSHVTFNICLNVENLLKKFMEVTINGIS